MKNYTPSQLTPWFSGDTAPARNGSYQVRLARSKLIVDGWFENAIWQIRQEGTLRKSSYANDQIQWRGLNREPQPIAIPATECPVLSEWEVQRNLKKIRVGMTYADVTALVGEGGKPSWCQPKADGHSTYTWADGDRWIRFVTFSPDGIVTEIGSAGFGD